MKEKINSSLEAKMRAIFMTLLLIGAGSCVEFQCYSSVDYAINEAKKFCNQANGNKNLCESLKIHSKNICGFAKDTSGACAPLGHSIDIFARISYPDCNKLDEKTCKTKESCNWTFKDPVGMKFTDF